MPSDPNLTEIATTTLRNRTKTMNKTAKDAKRHGMSTKSWKSSGAAKFEDTPKDKREDARLAAKHGMTMKQWEGSPEDRRHDIRKTVKAAVAQAKGKSK